MLWLLCALLSVFAKESGYIWFVCPPFIVWSVEERTVQQCYQTSSLCLALCFVLYLVTCILLTDSFHMEDNVYMELTATGLLRNLALLLGMTFYPHRLRQSYSSTASSSCCCYHQDSFPYPFFGFYCVLLSYKNTCSAAFILLYWGFCPI